MTREEERKQAAHLYSPDNVHNTADTFEYGAEWADNHVWKDAQGDNLPEIDREVIALIYLTFEGIPHYQVVFAHRPNPEGYDGKSVTTEKVEHCTPKTYDKGGWNIPDVKYWLDLELPKKN